VSTGDNAADARIVEALVSVRMGDNAADARIVEVLACVTTEDVAVNARNVEAQASVNTEEYATAARIVAAPASVSTEDDAQTARFVELEPPACVCTGVNAANARNVKWPAKSHRAVGTKLIRTRFQPFHTTLMNRKTTIP